MIRFFFLILFFSCVANDDITNYVNITNYPIECIKNAKITHTLNGSRKAVIEVGKIERFNDNDVVFLLNGVNLNIYNSKNILVSSLKSEKAEIDEKRNIYTALIDVVLSDNNEKTLKSNSLVWDKINDLVYTQDNVVIETKDEVIYGSVFSSDSKFEKYSLKNVKGKFDLKIKD